MATMEVKSAKETQNKKKVSGHVKTTRGEVQDFNRGLFSYMKRTLNLEERKYFEMKAAICPAKVNGLAADVVRYFNPDIAKEKGITIQDYESLNEHTELILYEGYKLRGRGGEINIKKYEGVGKSFLEEQIKAGSLTDVGVVIEKTAAQKWLGRIGTFMMMGGFMLVILLGVILVVLASVLFKC